jgi:2-oxo-3-hexenedioate decarboxylase
MHHDQLADDIIAARLARRTLIKPSDRDASFDLAEAYRVAACVSARWTGLGNARCGVKIGLTKRSAWTALGLNHPVWAPLYREAVVWSTDVHIGDMVAPRIEAEVVVGLASALGPGASCDEIVGALAWAALGFELVDSHFPGWRLTPPDLVADFGCHARLAVGRRRDEQEVLGVKSLADLGVTLTCDGEQVAHGRGADVLGGPLAALQELLAGPDAPQLNPGDIVATGSLTGGALAVGPGQRWRAIPESGSRLAPIDLRMVA